MNITIKKPPNVRLILLATILTAFGGCLSAETISLDAWKDAAKEDGPASIVYSSLRKNAEDAQRDKNQACGVEFTCINNDKFRGASIIDKQNNLRQALKNIDAERSNKTMTDSQYNTALDKIHDALAGIDDQRRSLIEDAGKREGLAKECARTRRATMSVYQEYLTRLESAERDPDNKAAMDFIRILQAKTKKSIEDHVEQHDRATKDAANCRSAVQALGELKKIDPKDLQ
jgi:hypothetical protein